MLTLNKVKANGLDNISARLLRECPNLIAESLTQIFNQSIKTGIFPTEWKRARVTPLYKNSGERTDPSNYRPISVIPTIAKIIKRIVYNQVNKYLIDNKLHAVTESVRFSLTPFNCYGLTRLAGRGRSIRAWSILLYF